MDLQPKVHHEPLKNWAQAHGIIGAENLAKAIENDFENFLKSLESIAAAVQQKEPEPAAVAPAAT